MVVQHLDSTEILLVAWGHVTTLGEIHNLLDKKTIVFDLKFNQPKLVQNCCEEHDEY